MPAEQLGGNDMLDIPLIETEELLDAQSGKMETQNIQEIPKDIDDLLGDEDNWDTEKGNQEEEYQKFKNYISTKPEHKENIFTLIRFIEPDDIGDYIYENGYIINEDTRLAFNQKFGTSTEDISEERGIREENMNMSEAGVAATVIDERAETAGVAATVIDERAETAGVAATVIDERAETKTQIDILSSHKLIFEGKNQIFSDIPEFQNILRKLNNIDENSPGEETIAVNEKILSFFQKEGGLEQVAQQFWTESPESYDVFKEYARGLDPSFEARFIVFENFADRNTPDIPSELHRAQVRAGLGDGSVSKYGQYLESRSGDEVVRMNIGDIPPTRSIGIAGSDLLLDTGVPIGEFYEAVASEGLKYEEVNNENTPKIEYLKRLQSEEVVEFIESDDFEKESFANVKRILISMIGLSSDMTLEDVCGQSFSSKEDIKQYITGAGPLARKTELEEEVEDARHSYEKSLNEHMDAQQRLQEQRDFITRDAIRLLTSLGIDVIWEDIQILLTDTAVRTSLTQAIPGFDMNNIDLATGHFGQSNLEKDSVSVFRRNMTMFANIIYFGQTQPQDDNAFSVDQYQAMELGDIQNTNAQLGALREGSGVISSGAMNISLIRNRLTSILDEEK